MRPLLVLLLAIGLEGCLGAPLPAGGQDVPAATPSRSDDGGLEAGAPESGAMKSVAIVDEGTVADLGVTLLDAAIVDTAMPDLAVDAASSGSRIDGSAAGSVDATASTCTTPPYAGTCAGDVLSALADCFMPTGACTIDTSPSAGPSYCFPSGALFFSVSAASGGGEEWGWKGPSGYCAKAIVNLDSAGIATFKYLTITTSQPYKLWLDDYDEHTGDATCADGTVVNVGPNDACGSLAGVLAPWRDTCTPGKCPAP